MKSLKGETKPFLDMVKSMLNYSSLLESFWGYALETSIYTLSLVPFKSVLKTPIELWKGSKPCFNHIRIWGTIVENECDTKLLFGTKS